MIHNRKALEITACQGSTSYIRAHIELVISFLKDIAVYTTCCSTVIIGGKGILGNRNGKFFSFSRLEQLRLSEPDQLAYWLSQDALGGAAIEDRKSVV